MTEAKLNNLPPAAPALLRAAGDLLPAIQETAAKLNLPFDASVNAQIVSQPGYFAMNLTVSMNAAPPATPTSPASPASPSSPTPPSALQEVANIYGKAFKDGFDRGYYRGHEDGYDKGFGDGANNDDDDC